MFGVAYSGTTQYSHDSSGEARISFFWVVYSFARESGSCAPSVFNAMYLVPSSASFVSVAAGLFVCHGVEKPYRQSHPW